MHAILRFPYAAFGAAAELAAALTPDGDAKWRRTFSARRGVAARFAAFAAHRDSDRPLAWFHAPSVGESLQALPVMRCLRDRGFGGQTAYTWYSPSAASFAPMFRADFSDYLPFDTSRGARAALDALRPSALVYSKLDVWPLLTAHAAHRHVPLGLISATLRRGSSRLGAGARAFLSDAYAQLDLVGAVSADDAERLVALGVRRNAVRITGDTRFDQVWERVHGTRPAGAAGLLVAMLGSDRPTVVAGSTWPADEHQLTAAWESVRRELHDARLIVAPHEPTPNHVQPLAAWARAAGFSVSLSSSGSVAESDVIIVDQLGVLGDLYALGTAAFVGGGFHGAGLHSVLEPAAAGVPVVFGPQWSSSLDAERLLGLGGAKSATNGHILAGILLEWLSAPAEARRAGEAAAAYVEAGLGAAGRSTDLVAHLLGTATVTVGGTPSGEG